MRFIILRILGLSIPFNRDMHLYHPYSQDTRGFGICSTVLYRLWFIRLLGGILENPNDSCPGGLVESVAYRLA